ncbi:MerR family transcriptional regulator [Kocuria rosea]|uniref:MerR family transcriptional regulator n=1 Tax=Kocuria rosea TaxID=1275 RepID=UPI00203A8EA6|nr:MerR family transcriptional regulator [Kocuria rosea]
MNWLIGEVALAAGVPSSRLRHYDRVGVLPPSRTGVNGRRYYDRAALLRLQRILLLREQGLGLAAIAEVLGDHQDDVRALEQHLQWLQMEQDRIGAQIRSVRLTVDAVRSGDAVAPANAFDGFAAPQDPSVEQPRSPGSYADIDRWWPLLPDAAQRGHQAEEAAIQAAFEDVIDAGHAPDSRAAQAVTHRLRHWLGLGIGNEELAAEAFLEVGEMYVVDLGFAAQYIAVSDATLQFIRGALRAYAHHHLLAHGGTPPAS